MNLHFRFGSIVILFFTIITSCKKSSDDGPRDPDKMRISKIISTNVYYTGEKSETVTSFIYDDQQRVDKIVSSKDKFSYTINYFYNGSDKKPYKLNYQTSDQYQKEETWYTYDNTGALIQDSVRSENTYETKISIRNYKYHTGKIIVKNGSYRYLNGGVFDLYESTDSILVYNANITTVINLPSSPSENGTFYRCTYDDKINPINKLNIAAVKVTAGVAGFPYRTATGICNNNIVEVISGTYSRLGISTTQSLQKYLYTYTREGLPETCEIRYPTVTYKYKYYYEDF